MIQVNQFNSLDYNPISEDQSVVQLRRHGQRVTLCVVHSSEDLCCSSAQKTWSVVHSSEDLFCILKWQ